MVRKIVPELLQTNGETLQLDDLDMKIVMGLLDDADVSSSELAKEHDTPLSTIQRRRTKLERSILIKSYEINTKYANWRSGEIFMRVGGGMAEAVGQQLFDNYENNITLVSTTMNNVGNLMAHIYYRNSTEMFSIVEQLKRIKDVQEAIYAEHIQKLGERKPRFILNQLRKVKKDR